MPNELSEAERIAIVETKVDNLDKKVDGVDENVSHLHKKFDAFMELFMTNKEAGAKFETVHTRIDNVEKDVVSIQSQLDSKRHNVPMWIAALAGVASVFVAVWAVLR